MTLLLLLACSQAPDCGTELMSWLDERCPCRAAALPLAWGASCRSDQTLRVEWEPALTGTRGENEDRVGGVTICECKGTTP